MLRVDVFSKTPVRVVVFEDTSDEQLAARRALESLGLKCEIIKKFDIATLEDDQSVLGVLTDVFLTTDPEGFGVAAYCYKHKIPCCIVTQKVGHNFSGWNQAVLEIFETLDIQIFVSSDLPKQWQAAAECLADKIHAKLMSDDSELASSYRRYVKYIAAPAK